MSEMRGEMSFFKQMTLKNCNHKSLLKQMKKLILTPKKDTLTICLPPDWVGKPLVCILKDPDEQDEGMISYVSDVSIGYQVERYRWAKRGRRPRRHRLRKKSVDVIL